MLSFGDKRQRKPSQIVFDSFSVIFLFCIFPQIASNSYHVPPWSYLWNIQIDSDQKTYFDQNFLTLSFFHFLGHFWPKKTKSHEKNFTGEKIFDFEIFISKYVSKHSEWIRTEKKFRPKFFDFAILSPFLNQKSRFLKFLGQKISLNFFTIVSRNSFPKF